MEEKSTDAQIIETSSPDIFADVLDVPSTHPHSSPIPVLPQLCVALGLLGVVFGVTYIGASGQLEKDNTVEAIETLPVVAEEKNTVVENPFSEIKIQGRAAIVWDVKDQRILFNKNADDKLPLASITKLMTALVAYELMGPENTVQITNETLRTEGDSGLTEGGTFSARDLIDLTLVTSSNDGAEALGATTGGLIAEGMDPEKVFITAMNVRAEEIGLTNTTFANTTGLDISPTTAGAYGSARDVAFLMEHIITKVPDAVALTNLEVTTIHNNEGAYHLAQNTNEYVTDLPGLLASKTGYTALAGGNLVVAFDAGLNRPIIVAVLGSSFEGRFSDTKELVTRAQEYINQEVD